ELECFIMVKCEGLTYKESACLLNLKIGSVQNYIKRAEIKIKNELETNLFI
ncbi:sigma factor-like helix-turn-helix DNA-binding protein, partial [Staphylococcus aureus]|nr:RNA polymerase subunit sigma-70 [Staphylococcus aureus]